MAYHRASRLTEQTRTQHWRAYRRAAGFCLACFITCVGALAILSCSDDEGERLQASLSGDQEVPPVVTTASGTVTLTVNDDRTQIDYRVTTVPPFTSDVRVAHIHVGQPGVNGPVTLFFCSNTTPPGTPAGVPVPQACPVAGGTITGSLTAADLIPRPEVGVTTFADAIAQILNGNTYSNVHTVRFPGGEIRGQDVRQ